MSRQHRVAAVRQLSVWQDHRLQAFRFCIFFPALLRTGVGKLSVLSTSKGLPADQSKRSFLAWSTTYALTVARLTRASLARRSSKQLRPWERQGSSISIPSPRPDANHLRTLR